MKFLQVLFLIHNHNKIFDWTFKSILYSVLQTNFIVNQSWQQGMQWELFYIIKYWTSSSLFWCMIRQTQNKYEMRQKIFYCVISCLFIYFCCTSTIFNFVWYVFRRNCSKASYCWVFFIYFHTFLNAQKIVENIK